MNGFGYAGQDRVVRRGAEQPGAMSFSRSASSARAGSFEAAGGGAHAISVMQRLGACLDDETAALRASPLADLAHFSDRKGQGLMELNRVLATLGPLVPGSAVAAELAALHRKIDQNMRVLKLHVSAVKEITGVITDAIQNEDSDGTYSPAIQARKLVR